MTFVNPQNGQFASKPEENQCVVARANEEQLKKNKEIVLMSLYLKNKRVIDKNIDNLVRGVAHAAYAMEDAQKRERDNPFAKFAGKIRRGE